MTWKNPQTDDEAKGPLGQLTGSGAVDVEIRREIYTGRSTIGSLFVNGEFECYTLEDCSRAEGTKVAGATCIPTGSYSLLINYSQRFKRLMPQLLEVPGFQGIRIHSGNTDADTEGCILVGQSRAGDFVGQSREAFRKLFTKLQAANSAGAEVRVRLVDARKSEDEEVSSVSEHPV